ncbi:TPA: hypothetical protein P2R00_004398 [Aeromonas veronii]|nr:hypothetical protein [Aeromonas veronii]
MEIAAIDGRPGLPSPQSMKMSQMEIAAIDGRPGLPSPQSMKMSQMEIAAIDPDFDRGYCLYP